MASVVGQLLKFTALIAALTVVAGCGEQAVDKSVVALEQPASVTLPVPASIAVPVVASPLSPDVLFAQISKSVVLVLNPEADTLGSGVEIAPGIFVTNCHVLRDGAAYFIRRHGQRTDATLLRADVERDVCLLRVGGIASHPIATRSAQTLKVGEHVYAIGNPQGLEQTFSEGMISQLRRQKSTDAPYIQTTAPISQGSSGGGLFDMDGKLIGIPTFMMREGQNLNFAIPVDWAIGLLGDVAPSVASDQDAGQDSRQDSEAVIDQSPEEMGATATRLIKAGHPDQAILLLEQVVQISTANAEAWGNLGYAYMLAGNYEAAQEKLERSIELSPERAASWLNLGQTQAELGARDVAVSSVLRGYGFASRKTAVREGLLKATEDSKESVAWRSVATEVLTRLE